MSDSPAPAALRSRPLRIVAVTLAALLLTSIFVYLGFPYERLAARVALLAESQAGYRVSYGPVGASPSLLGPGVAIEQLRASTPGGDTWDFSRVWLRPAWSLSWLAARPAVFVDAESAMGHIRGVTTLRAPLAFDGEATGLELASVLGGSLPPTIGISGTLDVSADVSLEESGPQGPVFLTAREGSLAYPALPFDVPYEQIEGEIRLGGEVAAEIVSLTIRSPMGEGSIRGTIGASPVIARAPLDLAVEITASDDIRGALTAQGVRLGRDGKVNLQLRGTLSNPSPVMR